MKRIRTRRRGRLLSLLPLMMLVAGLALIGYQLLGGRMPASAEVPENTALKLTVPKMEQVENVPVYDGLPNDKAALDNGALHVRGTGFPWQQQANVYVAGHRLGYAGTGSYLLFHDLDKLEDGDRILLTDSGGTRYTYEVFREFVVDPAQVEVARPIPGRNVVSLQTCTLPDYSRRLIVQGDLVSVS